VTSSRGGRGRDARAPVKGRRAACGRGRPRTQGRVRGRCLRPREGAQGCVRAGRPRTQAGGQDARAPRAACGGDACVPVKGRRAACGRDARAPRRAGGGDACAPQLTRVGFLASSCAPSPISAVRTPKLPLLPLWEKGVGGMRGKGARECRTLLISPKNSTLASRGVRGKSAPECRKSRISFKKSTLESAYPGAVRAGRPRPQTSVRAGRLRP
jgi:hypothetical protein